MHPSLSIQEVAVTDWPAALTLLFLPFPEVERQGRVDATLIAVAEGRLNLDGLRWALDGTTPVGIALTMEQPDGVTLVWPPVVDPSVGHARIVEDGLLSELTARLDASSARMAQILLNPEEAPDRSLYTAHGFTLETELDFLVRNLDELPEEIDLGELSVEGYNPGVNADRFADLIEQTYRGSTDCQLLDGLRTGREALASHQLSGEFVPDRWRLYRVGASDAALALWNDHPDQSGVELVYFGVAPEFRGRGYGQRLIVDGLRAAQLRGCSFAFCAVDTSNAYANSLYAGLGFSQLSRRQALFRPARGLAQK